MCVVRGLSAPGLVGAGFRRRRAFPPPATLPRCPPSRGGRVTGRRRSAARFLRLDVQRIGQGIYSPRAGLPAKLWTSLAPVSGIEFSVSRIFILGLVITAGPHSGRRRYGAPAISLAGRARNTDGTHSRASSGARSVVSGPFPEVLPPAWRRASFACDRTDPTERSRSRPRRRWGRRHAAPRNLGRASRAFVGLRYRSASIEPI